jgi:hypothetical protein
MTEKQKLFQELNDRMVKDLGIKDMEKEYNEKLSKIIEQFENEEISETQKDDLIYILDCEYNQNK